MSDTLTVPTPAVAVEQGRVASLFRPNQIVNKSTLTIMVSVQIVALLVFWFTSDKPYLPTPIEIVQSFDTLLFQKGLLYHLYVSTKTVCIALLLTLCISLTVSYLTVLPFFRPLGFLVGKLRFITLIGLAFVFTLVLGSSNVKLGLLVFGMSVFFVTAMVAVIQATQQSELDHARVTGLTEWQTTYEVIVLGKLDQVFEIARQNFAIGWAMLTLVESVSRSEGGIGMLLNNSDKHFHVGEIFAMQFILLAVGITLDYFIGWLRNVICPWAVIERR